MGRTALTSLWLTLPCVVFLGLTSAQPTKIKAKPGETARLPCQIASNIKVVEWSRPDLNPECVLLYQNKQYDQESQNPSFKNRTDLQIKEGNVTLILKNLRINDTGKYECRVLTNRRKRAVEPISIIYLSVVDPPGQTGGLTEDGGKEAGGKEDGGKEAGGKEDGSVGLKVGLPVFAVLLVSAVIGVLMYRKHKQYKSQDSYQPPVEMQSV